MWSKFSNAISKSASSSRQEDTSELGSTNHPNPSSRSLVSNAEVSSTSPPNSPSKRKGFMKRMSRTPKPDADDDDDNGDENASSSFKLPIGLPKRVKSHLHLNGNSSQASLARGSMDSRQSQDTLRSFQDPPPRPSNDDTARSPIDYGSVRSILRLPKTPGTGQNVRFFSRDAYKVISPDASLSLSTEANDPVSLMDRFQQATPEPQAPASVSAKGSAKGKGGPHRRPSVADIFASVPTADERPARSPATSLTMAIPSPDLSNIFDIDVPTISPAGAENSSIPLLDAIDMSGVGEPQGFTSSTPHKDKDADGDRTMFHSMALEDVAESEEEPKPQLQSIFTALATAPTTIATLTPPPSARDFERSNSFNFGQTVFYSLSKGSSSSTSSSDRASSRLSDSSSIFKSRTRALSDGVFQRAEKDVHGSPEADINDLSADIVVYSPEQPDPFRANATTYYTPQTMIPPTPPQSGTKGGRAQAVHARTASKEEDIIWSLRTQLALQQELGAQYEIDLGARDELVAELTARCEKAEKEGERRRSVLRVWKKKVGELERTCRGLEEEVERSREESFERGVMDEASGEALKCLQRRIEGLEREKAEGEKKASEVMEEKEGLEKALVAAREAQAQEQPPMTEEAEALLAHAKHASVVERERHRIVESEWEEERAMLIMRGAQVETDREELAVELAAAQERLTEKDNEYGVLKAELEAQWKHTENGSDKLQEMAREMGALRADIESLERRNGEMAEEWNGSENRRVELESEIQETLDIKEAIEREKVELEQQLVEEQEHSAQTMQALQERDDRIAELDSERQFGVDNVARLEENIRQRDAEIADFSQRVVEREIAAEQLREEMTTMKREHARVVGEQVRELRDVAGRDDDARRRMEEMVRVKAETDVALGTLKERVAALKEEVERLRRQVHELQQESADKEVKLVQLTKQKAQDKEDMNGLNIALDSKQQELELLKRKIGVKGTAGSTPAQPSKISHRRESSSTFSTPGIVRPPSALSDLGKDTHRGLETPIPKALGKSVRANGTAASSSKIATGSMGPPPPKIGRASMGTPTPTLPRLPSSHVRSSSSKATPTPSTPSIHRRASSTALEQQARLKVSASGRKISESSAPSELDEKENVDTPPTPTVKRRASAMTIAA